MSIKIKKVIAGHKAQLNPQVKGGVDILGAFDEIVQPLFPLPLTNLAIVLSLEGLTRNTSFELRVNGPNNELVTKGDIGVGVGPLGHGKKVIDLKHFLVKDRGTYSLDLLEKGEDGLKFVGSSELFIAEYPPKRIFREGEVEAILSDDTKIQNVKSEFRPLGAKSFARLQLNLDPSKEIEPGHIVFPSDDKLTLDGVTYDLTGLRRQFEWLMGNPLPKPSPRGIKTAIATPSAAKGRNIKVSTKKAPKRVGVKSTDSKTDTSKKTNKKSGKKNSKKK